MFELGLKFLVPATTSVLYHYFDLPWFSKLVLAKMLTKQQPVTVDNLTDTFEVRRRVGLRDLDIFLHMNNARYLWHMDDARYKFFFTSGKIFNNFSFIRYFNEN